jgi:hypothetical protein
LSNCSSHEVNLSLFFFLESRFLFTVFITVIGTHHIINHGWIVVSIVALATTSLEDSSLFLDVFVELSLLLDLVVVRGLEVVSYAFDVLWVTVLWHLLSQFLEELLNMVWCVTLVKSITHLLGKVEVVFFWWKTHSWTGLIISKKLIGQSLFSSLLENDSLGSWATLGLFSLLCIGDNDSNFGLSFSIDLVIIDLVGDFVPSILLLLLL